MATFRDIATDSLRKLGVIPHSSVAQDWMLQQALQTVNFMLDSWNADSFVIYTPIREVFPLVSGEGCYSIGPGGDFDTPNRNVKMVSALINKEGDDECCDGPQSQEFPMAQCSLTDWQMIVSKCVTSSWPQFYYIDNAWPLRNIKVYCIPSQTAWIVLYSDQVLNEIVDLDEVIDLPHGYKWMLVNNLAVNMSPDFGIAPDMVLLKAAQDSLSVVKRSNEVVDYQYADPAFNMGGNMGRFNILTNTFTPGIGR
jgi:hypothetical protein